MLPAYEEQGESRPKPNWFATTHWTVVQAAADDASPEAAKALEQLCRLYWHPLYAYLRSTGHCPQDSEDLTQAFFVHLLEKHCLTRANRHRGRFRTFLLTSLHNFIVHEWERARAEKRGGGRSFIPWDEKSPETLYQLGAASNLPPDKVFEQRWALTLFQKALARLREECASKGKEQQFEVLKIFLTEQSGDGAYASAAAALGTTPGAVGMAVHRLRQRYGEFVREEIAHTVASPGEVQEELRYLISLLSK